MNIWLGVLALALTSIQVQAAELKAVTPRPAANLTLPDMSGQTVRLDNLKGRVVLVNFWATWCPPCRKEMPSMSRLAAHFGQQPFTLLGVNTGETAEEVQAFLNSVPVNFPVLLDPEGTTLKPWRVFAFPTSYVVDKQGQVRLGLFGSIEWDTPETYARIEALLAEP